MQAGLFPFFKQSSLHVRIQLTLVTLLSIAFITVTSYVLHAASSGLGRSTQEIAALKAKSVAFNITDLAILGDFPAIEQSLRNSCAIDPEIKWIRYHDGNSKPIIAGSLASEIRRPEWFARLLNLSPTIMTQSVNAGGVHYGQVSVQVDATSLENKI